MPWRLIILIGFFALRTAAGAGGGSGGSSQPTRVSHGGGGGGGMYSARPAPGGGKGGGAHHMGHLNHQYMQTQQAIMMWNSALKSASQNPMDDWRRKEVQRTYESMQSNVAKLEAIAKLPGFDPSVGEMVKKDISSIVDEKSVQARSSDEAKPDGNDEAASRAGAGDTGATATEARALVTSTFTTGRPDIINLSIEGDGARKNETASAASEREPAAKEAGTGAAVTQGFPLRDSEKFGELQSVLTGDAKVAAADEGDLGSDARRKNRAPAAEGDALITPASDEIVVGPAGSGDEIGFDDEDVAPRKRPLLARLFGEEGESRLLALAAPAAKALGVSWGRNGKTAARRIRHRRLIAEDDGIDWLVVILKYIVLPSFLAAIIWIALLLRRVKLGYSANPDR